MHTLTAILLFCFTDMIQMKEIQSSKVFHLIKCRTEINRWMIDVSLKELSANFTILNFSILTNECTSNTSNAACFVEREGKRKFSILQFYTDIIGGNISYVCVKTMIDRNGLEILTTFTANLTVNDHLHFSETETSTSRTSTVSSHISESQTLMSTTLTSSVSSHISESQTLMSTTLTSSVSSHISESQTLMSTTLTSSVITAVILSVLIAS